MNIAITLTSSTQVGEEYIELTQKAAEYLANYGFGIVYGGTDYGMMSELAKSYKKAGGKNLTGVMSKDLMDVTKGYVAFSGLDNAYTEDDMDHRKQKIFSLSDGVLVLPGGWGTLDEFISIASSKINKLNDKPIAIYNYNGFYDKFINFLNELKSKGFTKINLDQVVLISEDLDEIARYFENYKKTDLADKFID